MHQEAADCRGSEAKSQHPILEKSPNTDKIFRSRNTQGKFWRMFRVILFGDILSSHFVWDHWLIPGFWRDYTSDSEAVGGLCAVLERGCHCQGAESRSRGIEVSRNRGLEESRSRGIEGREQTHIDVSDRKMVVPLLPQMRTGSTGPSVKSN